MNSFRIVHASLANPIRTLQLPKYFFSNYDRGFIPSATVFYTAVGEILLPITPTNDIMSNSLVHLIHPLGIEAVAYLEFESQSNTDIIVWAYNEEGEEMNDQRRSTHSRVHYLKCITHPNDLIRLVVPSNFGGTKFESGDRLNYLNPRRCQQVLINVRCMMHMIGGYYVVDGDAWVGYCRKYGIVPRSMVVFGAHACTYRGWPAMDMYVYRSNGFELRPLKPTPEICPSVYSFTRRLGEEALTVIDDPLIRHLHVHDHFMNHQNGVRMGQPFQLRTLTNIIQLHLTATDLLRLSGDWDSLVWTAPQPLVNFRLSLVHNHQPDYRPLYAIEFFKLENVEGVWRNNCPSQYYDDGNYTEDEEEDEEE